MSEAPSHTPEIKIKSKIRTWREPLTSEQVQETQQRRDQQILKLYQSELRDYSTLSLAWAQTVDTLFSLIFLLLTPNSCKAAGILGLAFGCVGCWLSVPAILCCFDHQGTKVLCSAEQDVTDQQKRFLTRWWVALCAGIVTFVSNACTLIACCLVLSGWTCGDERAQLLVAVPTGVATLAAAVIVFWDIPSVFYSTSQVGKLFILGLMPCLGDGNKNGCGFWCPWLARNQRSPSTFRALPDWWSLVSQSTTPSQMTSCMWVDMYDLNTKQNLGSGYVKFIAIHPEGYGGYLEQEVEMSMLTRDIPSYMTCAFCGRPG